MVDPVEKWKPTPVFLGFPGGSDGKESACNVGDLGSTPGLGRSPGGVHGNPLQNSCLENPPWSEELGGLQSMGSQRVQHDWVTKHSTAHDPLLSTLMVLNVSFYKSNICFLFCFVSLKDLQHCFRCTALWFSVFADYTPFEVIIRYPSLRYAGSPSCRSIFIHSSFILLLIYFCMYYY